jgi:hypothetical protein
MAAEEPMRKLVLEKRLGLVAAAGLSAAVACVPALDTARPHSQLGSVGEEVYGVLCDRVGAQALPEDLTGSSFKAICHPNASGVFANTVNQGSLPKITAQLKNAQGKPVPVEVAQAARAHGVARIEALGNDRTNLIAALNATFPNVQIPIKDTSNPNAELSCLSSPKQPTDSLPSQLADLLGRFTKLYDDGTIPESTESFARVISAFGSQTDAQAAYARFNARQGYRPIDVALGAVRPVLAYPNLRDFANATLDVLSSTGNPYAPSPGPAYPELQSLLAASYQELRTVNEGTPVPLLSVSATLDPVGRQILSRPRGDLEFMQQIFFAQDSSFGGGPSQYIVQRDPRGYAQVALMNGMVPAPFVNMSGNGLADVNALGQFITNDGQPAPTPFFSLDGPAAPAFDAYGRAMSSASGSLYYDYIDTNHVYAASLLSDLQAFVDPNQADAHETLMYALAGAYVLMGTRAATTKPYAADPSLLSEWSLTHTGAPPASVGTTPVSLSYNGYAGSTSAMLDLAYGLANVAADRTNDDVLAYSQALLASDVANVARLTGVGLAMQANAKAHPEAHIPSTSTFWDEMIDVIVQIEQDTSIGPTTNNRLLEDVLTALGNPDSLLIPAAFGAYNNYNDAITYDTNNLNGPPFNLSTSDGSPPKVPVNRSMADTGANRSDFQRFTALIHDTDGLTVCNKANAQVLAQLPIIGELTLPVSLIWGYSSWPECAVFKIDNAAAFYLDSIVGKGSLYLRDDTLRNGVDIPLIGDVGEATVGLMEDSSGITGPWSGGTGTWASVGAFWDGTGSTSLRPTPYFLDRQLFFDQATDSTTSSGPNYLTNQFLSALIGQQTGTTVCPERIIVDPCASSSSNCADAPDIASDGLVHGLRSCPDGEWLIQRDPDTIFTWEDEQFYQAMTPVLTAFTSHNREDLFIALMETLDRHWADNKGTASECLLSVDPTAKYKTCTQDGLVTYEPLLVLQYTSDLIPALNALVPILQTMTIPHCDSYDPTVTPACTPTTVNGITAMANTLRSMFDPNLAAAAGLRDRHGNVTALRNDGTTNPQVTRIYLILEALNEIDAAFAAYAKKNPMDAGRQALWLSARSQLVDQFFTINGSGTSSTFADASVPNILPVVIGALRAQVAAHCPASFNAPYPPCAWAGQQLASDMQETVDGPLFAGIMDLADAVRQNDNGRIQLEQLLAYLLSTASHNDARAIMYGAADDLFQVLADDPNLVPFYHVLAEAARPSVVDADGNVVQKGVADAQMGLLSAIAARKLIDVGGKQVEDCREPAAFNPTQDEVDPNQVISVALTNLVTPMTLPNGKTGETPLEVMLAVVDDVNRAAPLATAILDGADYESIAANVTDFLTDKQRGMEQFYEVVRLGTQ